MTDYEAALKAAREKAIRHAARPGLEECLDAYEALAKTVGAALIGCQYASGVVGPCRDDEEGLETDWCGGCKAKAEADRRAAPYLEAKA